MRNLLSWLDRACIGRTRRSLNHQAAPFRRSRSLSTKFQRCLPFRLPNTNGSTLLHFLAETKRYIILALDQAMRANSAVCDRLPIVRPSSQDYYDSCLNIMPWTGSSVRAHTIRDLYSHSLNAIVLVVDRGLTYTNKVNKGTCSLLTVTNPLMDFLLTVATLIRICALLRRLA